MSHPAWQRLVLSLTVGGGVLCVLVAVYLFTRLLPQAFITAADLLPAEQTVLVIGDADNESLQSWRAWLPMPTTFPTETGAVMALLDLNDDRVWVTLIPEPGSDPPFTVTTSTPEAKALIGYGKNRLGDTAAFVRLRPNRGSWAWWSAKLLENQPAIPLSVTNAMTAGVVMREYGATTVTILPRTNIPATNGEIPSLAAGDLMIGIQKPAAALKALGQLLPNDVMLPIVGLLHERLKTVTGPDISPEFDLLPLLNISATLAVSHTGSGTLWTLRGRGDDLNERFSDLYGRAGWNGGNVTVDRRMIEGFQIDEVREGTASIAEETIDEDGWTGWVRGGDRSAVCMAWRGRDYIMSNAKRSCIEAIHDTSAPRAETAVGHIDAAFLVELRNLQLPGLVGTILQSLPDSGVDWYVQILNGALEFGGNARRCPGSPKCG